MDHAGHSYGANSQEMVKKLNQIDGWLEQAAGRTIMVAMIHTIIIDATDITGPCRLEVCSDQISQ